MKFKACIVSVGREFLSFETGESVIGPVGNCWKKIRMKWLNDSPVTVRVD